MTVIRIQELSAQDGAFQANLSIDNGPFYSIVVRNPFDEKQEEELEWYFEQHLRFPFTQKVRAREAAESITTYGEALFKQVFQENPDVYAEYKTLLKKGLEQVQIEIVGSPKFHALHWEALKDPNLSRPLSLQATMLRRNKQPPPFEASVQQSPTINLLVVTSRPYGMRDVSYRTISRPLVDTLRQTNLRVNIDILRPGTYKTLENHLRETTSKHGAGYYHVIHFDLHGSLLDYQLLQAMLTEMPEEPASHSLTYQKYYALKDIAPYEGEKAFLFFEGEEDESVTPVESKALADMLAEHHIPIAILNACQTAKQVGESETSLGSSLMQAGVQLVLAMCYSITVSAAELLMQALYQRLFAEDSLSLAIRQARYELYNNKRRRAYYGQQIDLEDWLLPVVYQNRPVQLSLRDLTPEENKAYYDHQAELEASAPPEPTYGFVGRDLDILRIERRLLLKRNILLVRGMGGAGKTTLLRHLGAWWRTTGLVERVFYFGYDEQAWTRQQIMVTIAQQLLDPVTYLRDFQPLSLEAQQAMLTRRLRSERHLLILDNLESITGANLAILHTLDQPEQESLRRFVAGLAGGKTLVLLGSRGGEAWLAKGSFEDNIYDLPGLDPESATTLADRILVKHHATRYRQDENLNHLIKLLDGFPLALEVVLPNLAHQTPQQVLAALQAGDVDLDKGNPEDKTRSILRCIDYSHSNLSPEAQQLLLCLAPFISIFDIGALENYVNHLKQQPVLSSLPFDRWPEVLQEAANWGLLSPDPDNPRFLHLQPILPYFLHTRMQAPAQVETRLAIETAFREHYRQVASSLDALLTSKDPQERQIGQFVTSLEYENLVTAFKLAIGAQSSIAAFHNTFTEYINQTQSQSHGLELYQYFSKQLADYPPSKLTAEHSFEYATVLVTIANWQFVQKQYEQAEVTYQAILELVNNLQLDERQESSLKAATYHQLGYIAQERRQWEQAEHYYQQALQINVELNNRYQQANNYHNLGMVAQEQQHWEQAEHYYQQALQLDDESNDRYAKASTYHQLGKIAWERHQLPQAKQYFLQALQIYVEFNDRYSQADTYQGLGAVAQKQRQWQQAEQYYQQALRIKIEFNDRYSQADAYHNLGVVAQRQYQWQQAEQYYQQALRIKIEFNDPHSKARTYAQLGTLDFERKQWVQARDYLLQALEIFVGYEDNYNASIALSVLASLWQESKDDSLPKTVAEKLGMSRDEVEKLLREMLGEGDGEKGAGTE